MDVSFVTPAAGLIALVGGVPLLALLVAEERLRRLCAQLGIEPPTRRSAVGVAGALALVALLVGVAAAQPVVSSRKAIDGRVDAEAFFVFDVSRSMGAREAPSEPTRLARARTAAKELAGEVGDLPVGVASFTDRLLPHLFPTVSRSALFATIDRSLGIDRPTATLPWGDNLGTRLAAIGDLATSGYFQRRVERRVAVVFTDGETLSDGLLSAGSAGASEASLVERLTKADLHVLFVRLWGAEERVYERGLINAAYVPDPNGETQLETLAARLRTSVYSPDDVDEAAREIRRLAGRGPSGVRGYDLSSTELAPYVFALTLAPLLFLLWRRNLPPAA